MKGRGGKNTFICVKEKMKQEGCENLSQPSKLTGPDKYLLFLAGPAEQHFLPRPECSPKQNKPQGGKQGITALMG